LVFVKSPGDGFPPFIYSLMFVVLAAFYIDFCSMETEAMRGWLYKVSYIY